MIDREKLAEILHKHALFMTDKEGGERADLHGADLNGADLRGADLRETGFIIIGHIGSRNDVTYYHAQNDIVRCGCFSGTLDEFENAVRSNNNEGQYLEEYEALLTFIKSVSKLSKEQQK